MPTSKLDRLNKLFERDQRIAQPDADKPHIADLDFTPKTSTNLQAIANTAPVEEPVAQYRSKSTRSPPTTRQDLNLLTSSDEDEYVAAFSSKPTAKKPPINILPDEKPRRGDHQSRAMRSENHTVSANELSDHDVDGNPLTGHFCPLALVAKFPYKYMVDTDDRVSRHFFAQNKFYQRNWDIYYIYSPGSIMTKPVMLLPLDQVQHLIQQINLTFKTDIARPPDPFTVSFFDDGTPQPKHLGISRCREDLADMEASIPNAPDDYAGEPFRQEKSLRLTERSVADFNAKIERILASTKKNKQAAKKKKMDERFLKQQDWMKQLELAQRYLGLRPKATKSTTLDAASSWAEQQKLQEQDFRKCGVLLDPLDTSKPTPYAFESDPVIVCVDVEAYERDNRRITEVGVSTLDTLDLAGIAPGKGGDNWIAHIRSRHFRIRGREHLENKEFCPGDAKNFIFGKSEWVNLDMAAEAVDQCFEYPFSAQFKQNEGDYIDRAGLLTTHSRAGAQKDLKERNIIFVGHDIRNEVEYLRTLGCHVFSPNRWTFPIAAMEVGTYRKGRSETLSSIISALDTGVLYRVLTKDTQNQSLGKMMLGLGRTAFHLHNAGNDARYTLEAFIALLIKARVLEGEGTLMVGMHTMNEELAHAGDTKTSWKDEVGRRVKEKASAVEQNVRNECKGREKAPHTITITDNSGKQIEVEDPWLMAQESDQEFSQSLGRKGDEKGKWIEEADVAKTIMYRDPAATGGHYEVIVPADTLDSGEAERGRLAMMVTEGSCGKKMAGRHRGGSADQDAERGGW